jgi:hypothetical protein
MDLALYVDELRHQLLVAATAGGEEARAMAERLTAPLESSVRLVLLEAISAAADEITRDLAPGAVEVRLRAGEPTFVVSPPPSEEAYREVASHPGPGPGTIGDLDEGGTARLNLRLPEALKARIEEAARIDGLSLNTWLIRAATASLGGGPRHSQRSTTGGERYTGWVR